MRHYVWLSDAIIKQEYSHKHEFSVILGVEVTHGGQRRRRHFWLASLSLWRNHTRQFGVPAEL